MKKLLLLVVLASIGVALLAGCGSAAGGTAVGQEMDHSATVLETTDVYATASMGTRSGTIRAGERVRVTERWGAKKLCLVASEDVRGWVKCAALAIEE